MREVFAAFLRLGLTSFGGPVAHLGYFRRELVERRAWLDDGTFAGIVGFCSILPGPTSSQVGMLLGLARAGPAGALAAWLGFTLPSAVVMAALGMALGAGAAARASWFAGAAAGLEAAVAAVVAQAVLALAATLCVDRPTRTIALAATALAIVLGASGWQWIALALGALAGMPLRRARIAVPAPLRVPRWLAAGGALVAALSVAIIVTPVTTLDGVFVTTMVRAGSLVFGGGHIVLPLLATLVRDGVIGRADFFAGYGAAQAMPGPLSSVAAFLGADNRSALHGVTGAVVATVAIFAPSFGLVLALVPVWERVRAARFAAGALAGANAAVVGLLAAIFIGLARTAFADARVATLTLAAYGALAIWKAPPWAVVVACAAAGVVVA